MTLLLLVVAAFFGGAANALAGGGQFVIFPALLFAGVASVKANATGSLVVLPGGIASAWVYRKTLIGNRREPILSLIVISAVGSLAGSILLLETTNATFSRLVPWLLLMASAVFTIAPQLRRLAARTSGGGSMAALLFGQFAISVYGGYFGAGMGVLMLALFLAAGKMDIQTANGIRLVCGSVINILAVVIFAVRGAIEWKGGVPMLFAGVIGGYIAARVMRRMGEKAARITILIYAWALTAWFFLRP